MTALTSQPHGGEAIEPRASGAAREAPPSAASLLGSRDVSSAVRIAVYVAVAVGVVLRTIELAANRSLSQDEAMLALNVVNRPFSGLFHRLDFLQGAPVGFLSLQKGFVEALGNHEYSLRAVSFIAGAFAVALFLLAAREFVVSAAVPIAVVVFALSDPLITWTVWAKPYAVDVLFTVLLLALGARAARTAATRPLVAFALTGAAAIWFSYASIFVLAGISIALVGGALLRRDTARALRAAVASIPWLACFAGFALTMLHNVKLLQQLTCLSCPEQGAGGTSVSEWVKVRGSLGEFRYISGIPHFIQHGSIDAGLLLFLIALAFWAAGIWSIATRSAELAAMLVAPLVFMVIAWGFDQYPILGRTQLFLVPSFVLGFSEGLVSSWVRTPSMVLRGVAAAFGVGIVIAIGANGLGHVANRHIEDMKPVLDYIAPRERTGDAVYVFYTGQYQVRYYLECRCAGRAFETLQRRRLWPQRQGPGGPQEFSSALLSVPPDFIVPAYRGRNVTRYVHSLDALRGRRRVWFVLSSIEDARLRYLLAQLDRRGRRLAAYSVGSGKDAAGVYLYDLRR
jgi:hypothetical protein